MAEKSEPEETKKVINPRVVIDTLPPFESVKEAVDRFGGGGAPWIPLHLLRFAAAHHDNESFDMDKMEEQALQLETDIMMKEHETRTVLKELDATKELLEGLKLNLMPEFSTSAASPANSTQGSSLLCPFVSPGLMFTELNHAKMNLNKTSVDLAVIQASLESLNEKLRKDKVLLERTKMQIQNSDSSEGESSLDKIFETASRGGVINISDEQEDATNFEAEQFKKMTEASRYEVMKAMMEIERTKNSIKMAEMRLNAAKKMEEAAKAVEAIAIAERKALWNGHVDDNSSDINFPSNKDDIMLSFEEYRSLTQKAERSEDTCKTKFIDTNGHQWTNGTSRLEVPVLEKFEDILKKNKCVQNEEGFHQKNVVLQRSKSNSGKFIKLRNSKSGRRNPNSLNGNESNATASFGDVLRQKLAVQDDTMMGRHVENNHSGRERVSLSQMLREQSRHIFHPNKPTVNGNVEKQSFFQKKFGFIQVPIPTKQSKKKAQPLNVR